MSENNQQKKEKKLKKHRTFKVIFNNELKNSTFKGDSPYQAANKALSETIRSLKKTGGNVNETINFTLVETTKDSDKKEHDYSGYRLKLDNPITYTVSNGQTITKEYKNVLKKEKKLTGGSTKK